MIDHIVSREFIYCVGCKHTIFNLVPGHNKYICWEKYNLSLSNNEISYLGVPYPGLDSIPATCIFFPSNIFTTQLQEETVWYWASEWCEANNCIPPPAAQGHPTTLTRSHLSFPLVKTRGTEVSWDRVKGHSLPRHLTLSNLILIYWGHDLIKNHQNWFEIPLMLQQQCL